MSGRHRLSDAHGDRLIVVADVQWLAVEAYRRRRCDTPSRGNRRVGTGVMARNLSSQVSVDREQGCQPVTLSVG